MRTKHDRGIVGFGFKIYRMIGRGGEGDLQFWLLSFDLNQPRDQLAHCTCRHFQAHDGLLRARLFRHGE